MPMKYAEVHVSMRIISPLRQCVIYSMLIHGFVLIAVCSLFRAPVPHGVEMPGILIADLVIAAPRTAHTDEPLEEFLPNPAVETAGKAGFPSGDRMAPALPSFQIPDPSVGMRTVYYLKSGRLSVTNLLSRSLDTHVLDGLSGQAAVVELRYDSTRHIESLVITPSDESSRELAELLQSRVTWESVPAPAEYSLPYRILKLKIRASERQFAVALEPA
jgi:hypothetical protein